MNYGYGFLNLGSLLLGLVALTAPAAAIFRDRGYASGSSVSFAACSLSLLFQLLYGAHLVKISDYSAIDDTWVFVGTMAVILFVCVLAVNAVAWTTYSLRRRKNGE